MAVWSYSKAVSAIEHLRLDPSNMRIACYWLTLWRGDTAPTREQFSPSRIADLLGGIALCEMKENLTPVCRLAGTAVEHGLGFRLTGTNMLDYLPNDERSLRIARVSTLVSGAVAVSRSSYETREGNKGAVETVQLPFAGASESGSRQFLSHINWRPAMGRSIEAKPGFRLGLPDTYLSLPIV
jgi:hypothetical protein